MSEPKGIIPIDLDANGIGIAVQAGESLASLQEINREEGQESTVYVIKDGFTIQEVDNKLDRPVRKTGTTIFTDVESFCWYVNKHQSEDETIIIADEERARIQAVINSDGVREPNWSDFQALLKLGFSRQWELWFKNSHTEKGQYFDQVGFADFIEDNRSDITYQADKDLTALQLSSILCNLQSHFEEKFTSKIDPVSGGTTLHYENNETGKGLIAIPKQINLIIPIYKNGDIFQVTIRIRHRRSGGSIVFYYIIDQIDLLKQKAFDKICLRITKGETLYDAVIEEEVFEGTGLPVLRGVID